MSSAETHSLILLGSGYTGHALIAAAPGAGFRPIPTSRTPAGRTTADGTPWVQFDLDHEATWANVPRPMHWVWLFPALPLERVVRFATEFDLARRRLVVVGTTSSYLHEQDGVDVNEENPLDVDAERVRGEEYLRSIGATVLRASGIYGPAFAPHRARNPLSWLRREMIASPESWVNLIHVSDLAAALLEALKRDLRGEQIIVSDGSPRRWGDIGEWAVRAGLLGKVRYVGAAPRDGKKLSKRLSNARLISRLGPVLTHTDLFGELVQLEQQGG